MQQSADRNVAPLGHIILFPSQPAFALLLNAVWRSNTYQFYRAILAVIVWLFDLQLPMQSVPIITDVVSSNLDQGDVYNIM